MDKKNLVIKKHWPTPSAKKLFSQWESFRTQNQLKKSEQRELIIALFFDTKNGHFSIDELLAAAKKKYPSVGYATVYRTMKLLESAQLAVSRQFIDGQTRYEITGSLVQHHDHLICIDCGHITEFECDKIESLQKDVVKELGDFSLFDHRMELYVKCNQNQSQSCKLSKKSQEKT